MIFEQKLGVGVGVLRTRPSLRWPPLVATCVYTHTHTHTHTHTRFARDAQEARPVSLRRGACAGGALFGGIAFKRVQIHARNEKLVHAGAGLGHSRANGLSQQTCSVGDRRALRKAAQRSPV